MMITRTIMVKNTAKKYKKPIKLVKLFVDDFLRQTNEALLRGDRVWIRHFGVFYIMKCKPRTAMNVSKGLRMQVPAKKRIRFKACSIMREKVNA